MPQGGCGECPRRMWRIHEAVAANARGGCRECTAAPWDVSPQRAECRATKSVWRCRNPSFTAADLEWAKTELSSEISDLVDVFGYLKSWAEPYKVVQGQTIWAFQNMVDRPCMHLSSSRPATPPRIGKQPVGACSFECSSRSTPVGTSTKVGLGSMNHRSSTTPTVWISWRYLLSRTTKTRGGKSMPRKIPASWKATRSNPWVSAAGKRPDVVRHVSFRDGKGTVRLRVNRQMHHIPCGRQFAGLRVRVFVEGLDITVIGVDGQPVRHLTLDPTNAQG